MDSFFAYAIKSGISLTVLYLFYWLVLQKDTHFWLNRIVLLSSVVISMALPAMAPKIMKTPAVFENLPTVAIDFGTLATPISSEITATAAADPNSSVTDPATSHLSWWQVIAIIYIVGALIVFARLIYQAIFLHAVARLSEKTSRDGYTIVSMTTDMVPFSYFNRIFIPNARMDEGSFDSIIAHEKTHLSQWHYIDLFIIEMISVLQWFNPIVWLYEKSIKEVHEYLADESVLHTAKNPGRYQALMVNQAMGGPVFILTNQFNQSLIKKRIIMMKKMKNSRAAQLKALLIVPIIAVLLLAFASPQLNSQSTSGGGKVTVAGNVTDRSTGKVIPGCAIVIQGTTVGVVTDTEGNYGLVVDKSDAVLVFSQVGYRTQAIPMGTNTKINVQLEQDILAIDFTVGNRFVLDEASLKVRQDEKPGDKGNNYVIIEKLPAYPGGTEALLKFLQSNLRYPEDARSKGIQGTVMMTYIIDANGEVKGTKILRGVSHEIDLEALRLTNSITGWKPASQNGNAIPTTVTMPIEFRLNN